MKQATTPITKYLHATMQKEFWQKVVEYPETAELTQRDGITWKHPNSYFILNTDSITKFKATHIVMRETVAVYHGYLERHDAVTTISHDPLYYDFDRAYEAFLAPALKEYKDQMKMVADTLKSGETETDPARLALLEQVTQLCYQRLLHHCARKGLVQEYQHIKTLFKPELVEELD